MKDQDWIVRIEKSLTAIQKDVEYIKERLPACEKTRIIGMIKTNRWMITTLVTIIGVITGAVISKN